MSSLFNNKINPELVKLLQSTIGHIPKTEYDEGEFEPAFGKNFLEKLQELIPKFTLWDFYYVEYHESDGFLKGLDPGSVTKATLAKSDGPYQSALAELRSTVSTTEQLAIASAIIRAAEQENWPPIATVTLRDGTPWPERARSITDALMHDESDRNDDIHKTWVQLLNLLKI